MEKETETEMETEMEMEMEMLTRHSHSQCCSRRSCNPLSILLPFCIKKKTAHKLRTAVSEKGALQMPLQSSDTQEPL